MDRRGIHYNFIGIKKENMKRFLVTGGAGFIGSNFIHYLLREIPDIQIINLDALTYAGNLENLSDLEMDSRYKFIHGNINDQQLLEDILKKTPIDNIIHFAAESHVDRSITNPLLFIHTNVLGTTNLLLQAKKYWTELDPKNKSSFRFLHISTDEVFGSLEKNQPAFSEKTPYAPNSPYAASKAASDHIVRSYFHTYGLPTIVTNCSNNYGSYQYPEKLIPLIISNAINEKPLPIYGDGKQIRDWLYVLDHCEALLSVLHGGTPGDSYNIGGNNQPTNFEVVQMVCKILDEFLPESKSFPHDHLIEFVNDRPGHDRRYAMNLSKIKRKLSWQPSESLESGLRRTIRWYLDHKEWVNSVLEKKTHKKWITKNYQNRGGDDK